MGSKGFRKELRKILEQEGFDLLELYLNGNYEKFFSPLDFLVVYVAWLGKHEKLSCSRDQLKTKCRNLYAAMISVATENREKYPNFKNIAFWNSEWDDIINRSLLVDTISAKTPDDVKEVVDALCASQKKHIYRIRILPDYLNKYFKQETGESAKFYAFVFGDIK